MSQAKEWNPVGGTTIKEAAAEACRRVSVDQEPLVLAFNGKRMEVAPGATADAIEAEYWHPRKVPS